MLLCTLILPSLCRPFLSGVMPGFRTLIETDLNGCCWDFNEKNLFTHHCAMNHPEVFKKKRKKSKLLDRNACLGVSTVSVSAVWVIVEDLLGTGATNERRPVRV